MYFLKKTAIIILFCLLGVTSVFADHFPFNHPNRSQAFALQQDLRVFYKLNSDFTLMFEGQAKELLTTNSAFQKNPEVLAFRVGGLYRIHPNLKIGAYYQLYNRRNFFTGNLNSEHTPMIDLVPRFRLSNKMVFEFRVRNEFNIYSGSEQSRKNSVWYSIKLRPKVTYFLIKDAEFKLAVFAAYELYLPINYDANHIEHWVYTGFLIPLGEVFSFNPYYGLRINNSANGNFKSSITHIVGTGLILKF